MKKILSSEQSSAISIAVLLATIMVVMRHGFNLHRFYPGGNPYMPITDAAIGMEIFLSRVTDMAIPCFFAISGFLFFLGVDSYAKIFAKWKRRISSLLIPFLLWNLFFLVLWSVLAKVPCLHEQMMESFHLGNSWEWMIRKLTIAPILGHFWYIRTLIVLCLLSPVFCFTYRFRILSIALFAILVIFWHPIDRVLLSTEGLTFFYFGGMCSYNHWYENWHYQKISWLLPLGICFLIIGTLLNPEWQIYWKFRIMLSVIFLAQFSLFLTRSPRISEILLNFGKYSFCIYVLHRNLLGMANIFLGKFLPHTVLWCVCGYWVAVSGVVLVSWLLAFGLNRCFPPIYNLLTGGRGA